ncbi:hypothetical protein M378DRAFT_187141 [Amanita muscaria Koide BX008]|uniref:CBS domain-containing protein n=1 Tax=Amanita muscaria (strain Koide BX008) TaxID=946122 RepID=A0A0C2T943_AMAMK|nr:hypothetical protein M378DRAFT_187141 [Amanita muscaria Koide BX008]
MSYKRLSQSLCNSYSSDYSTPSTSTPSDAHIDVWIKQWEAVLAKDLIDSRIVDVDAETTVEEACDVLLKEDIPCLAIKSASGSFVGLLDFSDMNAFLTLAATRHTLILDDILENVRINQIIAAAKAGRVPVRLVSNLSEKNPLHILPEDANILDLLKLFSLGNHRVLINSTANSNEYYGMVSDRRLLAWFAAYAKETPTFHQYSSNPLSSFALPSLNLHSAVVSATSDAKLLDAMKLMSDEGVSSIAVLDEETGNLLSAVSVTDIGRVVVPSENNQILNIPLHHFISLIKAPYGSTDGVEKYPVYSVYPNNALSYTIEKLLATNAHRVFVTHEPISSPPSVPVELCGIASIGDILSLFGRLAKIPDIDPTKMLRHRRRASSASSSSFRSRSNSQTGIRGSPRLHTTSPPIMIGSPDSISILDSFQRRNGAPDK